MDITFKSLFITFLVYSFIGWILEIIVCSIDYKKIVNRGFLFGPLCPIYGFGSIAILLVLNRYREDPIVVFVFGVLITSILEYYTSYILEKIFHNKWWDYSNRIDSINGRICVGNMIGFGIGACAIIYLAQPLINDFIEFLPYKFGNILVIVLSVLLFADVVYSSIIAYALRNRIIVAEELKAEKLKKLPVFLEKTIKERLKFFNIKNIRYFRNFPNLKVKYGVELDQIKKWLEKNTKKKKHQK